MAPILPLRFTARWVIWISGFAELERARDHGFAVLATAAVNPSLDPFRSDPRWEPFLRSIEELAQAIRELQGTE